MKKVLSFVLVLTLVLGSFSMAFAATPTDVAGTDWENAVVALSDLGVVAGYTDGTYQPTKAVNRAEAAKLIIAALGLSEYAEGVKTTSFTDLDGYAWATGYIGYAESLGILKGVGNGLYNPGAQVTYEQVCTMIVRALGYTDEYLTGTWPANYVVKAKALGILDHIAQAGSSAANRGDVAVMIYNALDVEMVRYSKDGVEQGTNDFMLARLSQSEITSAQVLDESGVFNANNEACGFAEGVNLVNYYGAYGTFLLNRDGKISGVKEIKSTFLDGEYDAANQEFVVGDTKYILKNGVVTAANKAVASGGALNIVNTQTTGVANLTDEDAVVLAVDLNGLTINKIYSIITWNRNAIDYYAEDDFDAKDHEINVNGNDYEFELDKNGKIDMDKFALVGVDALDKIPEDAVVEVWTNGTYVKKLTVTTETVTGTITKVKGDEFYINGVKYKEDAGAINGMNLGDEGTAYLTNAGKVYDWKITDAAAGNYAVVVKEGSSTDAYGNVTKVVTLFTKEGKEVEYTLKDGVATTGAINGIVTYALDSKGKIKSITTGAVAKRWAAVANDKVAKNLNRIGNTAVASGIVVFVNEDGDWALSELKKISKDFDISTTTNCGILNNNNKLDAIALYDEAYGSEATLGLINVVTGQTNSDGDLYWYVEGFLNGNTLAAFTDAAYTATSPAATTTGAPIQKITVDANGIVTGIANAVSGADFKGNEELNFNVTKVDKANNEISDGTDVYGLTDDVVVYVYDADEEAWMIKSITNLKGKTVDLYQSDKNYDGDEYDIVIAY